jgi:hypothetical protein
MICGNRDHIALNAGSKRGGILISIRLSFNSIRFSTHAVEWRRILMDHGRQLQID